MPFLFEEQLPTERRWDGSSMVGSPAAVGEGDHSAPVSLSAAGDDDALHHVSNPFSLEKEPPMTSTGSSRTHYKLGDEDSSGGLGAGEAGAGVVSSLVAERCDGEKGRRFRRQVVRTATLAPRKIRELTTWLSELGPHASGQASRGRVAAGEPLGEAAKPPTGLSGKDPGFNSHSSAPMTKVESGFWQRLGREKFPGEAETKKALRHPHRRRGGRKGGPSAFEAVSKAAEPSGGLHATMSAPPLQPPAAAKEATAKMLDNSTPAEPESPGSPGTRPPGVFSANFEGSWASLLAAQNPQGQDGYASSGDESSLRGVSPGRGEGGRSLRSSGSSPSLSRLQSFGEGSSHVQFTSVLTVDSIKGCTFVNQYMVVGTLGRGAYGKVKLCLDTSTHQLFALKLVKKGQPQHMRLRKKLGGSSRGSSSNPSSGRPSGGSSSFNSSSRFGATHGSSSSEAPTGSPRAPPSHFSLSSTGSTNTSQEEQPPSPSRSGGVDMSATLSNSMGEDAAREIGIMRMFNHPNLMKLIEVIDDPRSDKVLLVLEYVEGGTLAFNTRPPRTPRLSEPVALQFFRDIVQGLDCLHAKSIAHADLKPDNLLLGGDGRVRIADFGSAVQCDPTDVIIRTSGTPAFFAPEMCEGVQYSPFKADLWALGVCLFKFVYGVMPFKADAVMKLYDEIQTAPLVFPEAPPTSPELRDLITGLLQKDPEKRLTLCGAMSHPWTTLKGAFPLTCTQTGGCPVRALATAKVNPLESLVGLLSALFEEWRYAPGDVLALEGTPATQVFYIEEGWVSVASRMRQQADEDLVDDEDSDADSDVTELEVEEGAKGSAAAAPLADGKGTSPEGEPSPSVPDAGHVRAHNKCAYMSQALVGGQLEDWRAGGARFEERSRRSLMVERTSSRGPRSPRMLAIMLAAARSASTTVPCMMTNAKLRVVLTGRGAGTFISEVSLMEHSKQAGCFGNWMTTVRAATDVKVLVLSKERFGQLLTEKPEAEAALRAAISMRKAELLKLEALERVSGLRDELEREFAYAQALGTRLSQKSSKSEGTAAAASSAVADADRDAAAETLKPLDSLPRGSLQSRGGALETIQSADLGLH